MLNYYTEEREVCQVLFFAFLSEYCRRRKSVKKKLILKFNNNQKTAVYTE